MVLSISIYICNTSGFVTSGSKFISRFGKLNLRKELNLSQILLEVDETLQLYSACLNEQKRQRWPPSIFYSFRDTNPRRLRRLTFTKNTKMNGNLFLLYIPFFNIALVYFSKFQHHIFIILYWWILKCFMEIICRFKCLMVEFKCLVSRVIAL